jgi:hypothetical protein
MIGEMIRLTDDLAAVRCLYERPLATLPDILVIDVAPAYRHSSLSLGRYYGIMVETEAESDELEAFLMLSRPAPVVPDLLDHRPSAVISDKVTIATYAPSVPGWPWLLLCYWPLAYSAEASAELELFARGAYTLEMYWDQAASVAGADLLLASLGRDRALVVKLIAPTPSGPIGQA